MDGIIVEKNEKVENLISRTDEIKRIAKGFHKFVSDYINEIDTYSK